MSLNLIMGNELNVGRMLISVMVLLGSIQLISGTIWPAWMDIQDTVESLGNLCDTVENNDLIGNKLGCNCKYPFRSPGKNLYADCSDKTLATEETLLPPRLNVSIHVRKIIFSNNYFSVLDRNTFGNVPGVFELSFENNVILAVNDLSFPRLTTLDLSHNLITNLTVDVFRNCPKLQSLDLSFNRLTFIEPETFNQLKYLERLNLGSNQIGIAVEYYDEYPFQLTNLEWLEHIDLSNNTLRDFPSQILGGSLRVKILSLKNNMIMFIPKGTFETFGHLEVLDLSGNLFNTLGPNAFHGLRSLKRLLLDANMDLSIIENHAFSGLSALAEISCERNYRLTAIGHLAFKADPETQGSNDSRPTHVWLRSNSLTEFDADLLSWKDMEFLDLAHNPWICDCNLQWIGELELHSSAEASILVDTDFVCDAPPPVKGQLVGLVDPDEMLCYSSVASIAGIVGIVIFCLLLLGFCGVIGLNYFGLLPDSIKELKFFENPLKKYSRVDPVHKHKPPRSRFCGKNTEAEPAPDLEWDTGDMGRV